jgi:hypothetical protein
LVELLNQKQHYGTSVEVGVNYVQNTTLADHLLANGVIVPPCKVGQKVYYPIRHTNEVAQLFVREIVYTSSKIQFYASYLVFTVDAIGKTVFLTREEAEKVLKEAEE